MLNNIKSNAKFRFLAFSLLILFILSSFPFRVQAQDDYYHRDFEWQYDGKTWTWNLSIPKNLYEEYQSVPVFDRIKDGPEGYGFLTTTNDYYLEQVAQELKEAVDNESYESFDEVSFVLAFVQSLDYTSDSVTSGYDEYPRFPLETLVDNGGDCEDTSILFATLTLIMDYGTVYLNPPEHIAVGILGDELSGYYWTYDSQNYYYCETTGDGWKIGDLPEELQGVEAYIYPIREWEQYTTTYIDIPPPSPTPTPTPSPSSSSSPTPSPTTSPSPTTTLTPTPTLTPLLEPTPTPNPEFNLPLDYIAGGITVLIFVAIGVFFLTRK